MSKPEVLIIGPMHSHVMETLDATYTVHRYWEATDKAAFIAERADGIRAIATGGHGGVPRSLIESLPNLQVIANFGVGYDSVDVAAASDHGVKVTNTPNVLNDEVADMGIALLLATIRRIPLYDRYVREGKWPVHGEPEHTMTLRNRTLGIIGLGRIGKTIARRAEAFDVPVVYHGRSAQKDVAYRFYPDLVAMARDVDILLAICPGGEATRGIVNAPVLEALGSDGIFINISRGSVVDEPALVKALQDGKIGGAGLDVFAKEPEVPAELLTMDNVVLQPHMGSATHHTRKAMAQLVIDNLAHHFAGKPLLTPVN